MKTIFTITFALLTFVLSISCKSPAFGPEYPVTDFSEYNSVVIAHVDEAVHKDQGYKGLESFNITIKKALKGKLKVGKQIKGKAKKEKARAVCPVTLDKDSDYLLLLHKSMGKYKLSRFSFPVKKGHQYFNDYIKQIEKILNKKN